MDLWACVVAVMIQAYPAVDHLDLSPPRTVELSSEAYLEKISKYGSAFRLARYFWWEETVYMVKGESGMLKAHDWGHHWEFKHGVHVSEAGYPLGTDSFAVRKAGYACG